MTFADIFSPYSLASFIQECYGKKYLWIDGYSNSNILSSLLSFSDIQTMLDRNYLSFPSIQLSKNGEYVEVNKYAHEVEYGKFCLNGVVNGNAVIDEFNSGSTIVINAINRHVESIQGICDIFEEALKCVVYANAYISPPNSTGFAPHFDKHDVVVMQVVGEKDWLIQSSKPASVSPVIDKDVNADCMDSAIKQNLKAGNILYLPRGIIHSASTAQQESIHISFGVHRRSWFQPLDTALTACSNESDFREQIPLYHNNFSSKNSVGQLKELQRLASKLIDQALLEASICLGNVPKGGVKPFSRVTKKFNLGSDK